MDRRLFLKNSLQVSAAACGAGFLSTNLFAQNKPIYIDNGGAAPQPHLTCYPNTENGRHQLYQLWVRDKHNRVLTSYRAHQTQKYPFFYPVAGPVSGLSLTAESAMPWPHHRSLFFGQDRVNGGNYWQEGLERGQICSQGPSFAKDESGQFKIDDVSAEIVDTCLWRQPNQEPIIEDSRRFLVKILDDRRYILDADIVLRALTTVTFEKTNHGLFGIRCAPELAPTGGGNMLSSEGKTTQRDTEGKPARWMAFYGPRKGIFAPNYNEHFSSSANLVPLPTLIIEGIAVLCPSKAPHPLFENCPWFTRDYGNCSPSPMNYLKDGQKLVLEKGEELKLRYRVVAFAGTPQDAKLDELWEEFDRSES